MKKHCRVSGVVFEVTDEDLKFYEKMKVPTPTLCPDERARNLLAWRNERNLYQRTCSATGKPIISIFSSEKPFPVFEQNYWWGDAWDPLKYGREFDFSQPFFKQFKNVFNKVPQLALNNSNSENSEFTNQSQGNKDCYLVIASNQNRQCLNGMWFQHCVDCMDCLYLEYSELCYQVVNGNRLHSCAFSQNLENCSECLFCRDCIGCKNCFGSVNLRNKDYYFLNKPCTKTEYLKKLSALKKNTPSAIEELYTQFLDFSRTQPYKFYQGKNNQKFSGDYLQNTKNTQESFNCRHNENTKFCRDAWKARNCYDLVETLQTDFCYQLEGTYQSSDCTFGMKTNQSSDCAYTSHCYSCNNLFGCVGLKHAITVF